VIKWVGESGHWPISSSNDGLFVMPLVEETVLEVAFSADYANHRRLLPGAAAACTSRLAQCVALSGTGLNPKWEPIKLWADRRIAVKAAASSLNQGVRFYHPTEYTELLTKYLPELVHFGVMEEFLDGAAWEIDGAIVGGQALTFHPLLQEWSGDGTRILAYRRATPEMPGIQDAALAAVHAVGLDDCPFCVELREAITGWKVIEIHARLGEDQGLAAMMSDEPPLEAIRRFATKVVSESPLAKAMG